MVPQQQETPSSQRRTRSRSNKSKRTPGAAEPVWERLYRNDYSSSKKKTPASQQPTPLVTHRRPSATSTTTSVTTTPVGPRKIRFPDPEEAMLNDLLAEDTVTLEIADPIAAGDSSGLYLLDSPLDETDNIMPSFDETEEDVNGEGEEMIQEVKQVQVAAEPNDAAICTLQANVRRRQVASRLATLRRFISLAVRVFPRIRAQRTVAIEILQKNVRKVVVRRRYQLYLWSLVALQAQFRRRQQERWYQNELPFLRLQHAFDRTSRQEQVHRDWERANLDFGAARRIQRWYRGQRLQQAGRKRIMDWKAARCIQAAFRGNQARRELQERLYAVTVIQRLCRQRLARDMAARHIQTVWRGYQSRRLVKQARRSLVRARQLQQMHSATLIQAQWRGWATRVQFLEDIFASASIFCLSRRVRTLSNTNSIAHMVVRAFLCRQVFLDEDAEASKIQRVWKAALSRRRFARSLDRRASRLLEQRSANMVQGVWRRTLGRRTVNRATVRIQSCYRRHQQEKEFHRVMSAGLTIQSICRLWTTRMRFMAYCRASRIIQWAWRQHVRVSAGIVRIQSRVRGVLRRSSDRRRAEREASFNVSSVRIQSTWRKSKLEQEFRLARAAAVRLQSTFRGKEARNAFRELVDSHMAVKLQALARMIICRRRFRHTLRMVCQIQATTRRLIAYRRTQLAKADCSAVVIQSVYRQYRANRHLLFLNSTIRIQSNFRAMLARHQFVRTVGAAATIQAYSRSCLARERLKESKRRLVQHQRATLVQSVYRKRRAANLYRHLICCVVMIQSALRSARDRRKFLLRMQAINCIQSFVRQMIVRKRVESLLVERRSVVLIQSTVRALLVRARFVAAQRGAVIIQAHGRQIAVQRRYLAVLNALCSIQARFRGIRTRRTLLSKHQFATMLQSLHRRQGAMLLFESSKRSATKIQALARMVVTRRDYWRIVQAVCILQGVVRRVSARRRYETAKDFAANLLGATKFQALYRGYRTSKFFQLLVRKTVLIQAYWRGSYRRWTYIRVQRATVAIQAQVRGLQARKLYRILDFAFQRRIACATQIQARFRAHVASTRLGGTLVSAIKIQAFYRSFLTRQLFLRLSTARIDDKRLLGAIKIQATLRKRVCDARYKRIVHNVIRLQAMGRMALVRKEYLRVIQAASVMTAKQISKERRMTREQCAATKLQSIFRRYGASLARKQASEAVMKLQARQRGNQFRSLLRSQHDAATTIQLWWTTCSIQEQYNNLRSSTILIQRTHRSRALRQEFERATSSTRIQAAWRRVMAQKCYRQRLTAIVRCQSIGRGRLIRKCYSIKSLIYSTVLLQAGVRGSLQRRLFKRQAQCSTKIAATLRGAWTRRRLLRGVEGCTRIQSAYRRRRERSKYQLQRASAIRIQYFVRRLPSSQSLVESKVQVECLASIITLQRAFRIHIARQRLNRTESAKRIQSVWKRDVERHRLQEMTSGRAILRVYAIWKVTKAVSKLGTSIRMMQESIFGSLKRTVSVYSMLQFQAVRSSIRLMRFVEDPVLLDHAREHLFLSMTLVATLVQSVYRGHRVRCKIKLSVRAASTRRQVRLQKSAETELGRKGYEILFRSAIQKRLQVAAERQVQRQLLETRQQADGARLNLSQQRAGSK